MKHKKKSIRLPIQRKLFLFFMGTILLPLLLFGAFLFSQLVGVLESEVSKSAQDRLEQMAERMSLEFTQVRSISNLFYLDRDLVDYLETYTEYGETEAASRYNIGKLVRKYNSGLNNITFQVAVVAPDGKVFGNPMFLARHPTLDLAARPWYARFETRPTDILWTADAELDKLFSTPGYPYMYVVRRLENLDTWQGAGTLIIGVSELNIQKMYSGYVQDSQSTYLLGSTGNLISHVDNLGRGADPGVPREAYTGYKGVQLAGSGPGRVLVSYHTINATQWKLVTVADMNALLADFAETISLFVVLFIAYLALTVFLSVLMARRFVVPINRLYQSIQRVKAGQLEERVEITTNDEVADVSRQFNDMLQEIQDLMANLLHEQKQKRDAEIVSLQTQINPHFLYNTLASVRFLVYSGDKEAADEVILALIRLMKNTLSDADEFVTVEKETSLLEDYIRIQQMAFPRPVDVQVALEPDILGCKIIKLLLQPVVENAFLHGLKPKKGDCRLVITGRAAGDVLEFVVEDNGVGFDAAAAPMKQPGDRSIGLRNVHNRILLTFGEAYGVQVESKPGHGTRITLRIPKIDGKGGYSSYEHLDS